MKVIYLRILKKIENATNAELSIQLLSQYLLITVLFTRSKESKTPLTEETGNYMKFAKGHGHAPALMSKSVKMGVSRNQYSIIKIHSLL